MSESINNLQLSQSEDIMDSLSVSDDFDMTHEEEKSLLHMSDDMTIDSPLKKTADSSATDRKRIVFDLNDTNDTTDSIAEEDEDRGMRDKFRTERTTINFTLNESSVRREIPDSLDFIKKPVSVQKFLESKKMSKSQRKRLNRRERERFHTSGPQMSNRLNRSPDLRQFINRCANSGTNRGLNRNESLIHSNALLQNQSIGLSPLMNWQLGLGILDPNLVQNQLLVNALLAQNANNPLLNRLQMPAIGDNIQNLNTLRNTLISQNNSNFQNNVQNTNPNIKTSKDDIQITIINNNNRPTNSTKTHTMPQIRCRVNKDPTDYGVIENMPSLPKQTDPKPQLKTLFSKHLSTKVSQTASSAQESAGGNGDLFGEALAEAAVGCDNDYLVRMKEMENKRREIQRMKEQRRMEMADERLQSAQELKIKITEKNKFRFN